MTTRVDLPMDSRSDVQIFVETRPPKRWEPCFWVALAVVYVGSGFVAVFMTLTRDKSLGTGAVIAVILMGTFWCLSGPGLILVAHRRTPRGSWRIDADGITYRSTRGKTRSLRWSEVEKVCWRFDHGVAFVGGRTQLFLPLSIVDEPARSATRARLETILGSDFDLTHHPLPDPLDDVEPAWLAWSLRIARLAALSLGITAALMGSMFLIFVRYPERGAWQVMAFLWVWLGLFAVTAWQLGRTERDVNPTWRARLVKGAKTDPWDDW